MKKSSEGKGVKRLLAIYSGGDWNDADCRHLVLLKDIDLDKEKENHNKWYKKYYCPKLDKGLRPTYYSFDEWLIKKGFARKTKPDELQEYDDIY